MNWKECVRKQYYPIICLQELRKPRKNLSQDIESLDQALKPGALKYEAQCYSLYYNIWYVKLM
ncbi:hypothetical protein B7P43_G15110 [Cryptotermes secundus]|uniref:Uncharacterized protein n=1 Tax=Cryptotermes secundus TaxID=105785 RepID=A0A2J7PIR2_9NEOP|nr:hypothetical protein B7P43_G15110 [Cryptotermes secundus]